MKELRKNLLEDDVKEESVTTEVKKEEKAEIKPAETSKAPVPMQSIMPPAPVRKKKKTWPLVLLIVGILGAGVAVGLIMTFKNMPKGLPVESAKATVGSVSETISFSGTVRSAETKAYFAPVTGTLTNVYAKDGDIVKAGDLLVSYDVEELENAARSTELQAKADDLGIDANIIGINKQYADYVDNENKYNEALAYLNHWSYCLEMSNREYSEAMAVKNEYNEIKATVDALKIEQADRGANPNPEIANMIAENEAKLPPLAEKMAQYDYVALEGSVKKCSEEMNEYKAMVKEYEAQRNLNPALPKQKEQQQVLSQINDLNVENAHDNIEKARAGLTADFNGILSDVAVTDGQSVQQGFQLFTLKSTEKINVLIIINKSDLQYVSEGMEVSISINGNDYTGKIVKINREAKTASEGGTSTITGEVEIENPDENIYLGIEAKVTAEIGSDDKAILVPVTAVNYDSKGTMCYVVDADNKVERREVVTGLSSDDQIQIISGINEGEVVITDVTDGIEEGVEVQIKTEEDGEENSEENSKDAKEESKVEDTVTVTAVGAAN